MDRIEIGVAGIAVLLFLLVIRIPVGIAMGLVAFAGIWAITSLDVSLGIVKAVPFELIGDWNLSAVPAFLLMGYVASSTGLTTGLFNAVQVFFGRVPGGLATTTLLASGLFASASGSSTATAAAFSKIAIPEMLRAKYNPGFAAGCVAACGTLGSLIPPSLLMIVYGIMMNTSISELFIAGVIPGIVTMAMFFLYITSRALLNPSIAPRTYSRPSREQMTEALASLWALPILIVCVLGGIFLGVFTPTEAGAVGAVAAALIAAFNRKLTVKSVTSALRDTAEGTSTIFMIVVGALLLQRFVALSGLPAFVSMQFLEGLQSDVSLVLIVCVVYLILGMFLDCVSIMLLTLPILSPIVATMGIDLIWFCIIIIKLLEISLLTPPVGLNVYVVKASMGTAMPLTTAFAGAFGFVLVEVATLSLLIWIPSLSTWLPQLMR